VTDNGVGLLRSRAGRRTPGWTSAACAVLALLGLGVSVYLAVEHATNATTLACPETGTVNCMKVTTSSYATVMGIPVAYLGVAYYIVVAIVVLARLGRPSRLLRAAQLVLAPAGLLFVFYLLWAEVFRLHAICLWCTGVHVITFVLFAVTLLGEALRLPDGDAGAATDDR